MKKLKYLVLVMILTMATFLLAGCSGSEQAGENKGTDEYSGKEIIIKCGFGAGADGSLGTSAKHFKEKVEERTGGLVEVQLYPSSSLGSVREVAEGVAIGTIEMGMPGMGTFADFYKPLAFANTPFLFESREQSYRFYDGELMQEMNQALLEKTGIRILAYSENGLRCLTNNKHPIRTPADVKGLKVRTQENPLHIEMIKLLGGTATPISFGELYSSLQQLTVDGQDNPISLTVEQRFYEVQKYLTTTNHTYDQIVLCVSDDWWNLIDPSLQKIITEEAANWRDDLRKLSIQFDEEGLQVLADAGCEVIQLTPEERQAFKDLMDPAYDLVKEMIGDEMYARIMAEVEASK